MKNKRQMEAVIKRIEAKHSPKLGAIMEEAFREFLMEKDGYVDEEKLDRMLNLNASGLYTALSKPMFDACGITLR